MEAPSRVSLGHSLHSRQGNFKVGAGGTFYFLCGWSFCVCFIWHLGSAHCMHVKDLKGGGDCHDNGFGTL